MEYSLEGRWPFPYPDMYLGFFFTSSLSFLQYFLVLCHSLWSSSCISSRCSDALQNVPQETHVELHRTRLISNFRSAASVFILKGWIHPDCYPWTSCLSLGFECLSLAFSGHPCVKAYGQPQITGLQNRSWLTLKGPGMHFPLWGWRVQREIFYSSSTGESVQLLSREQ